MRDQRVYAAGAASAVKVSQSQTAATHLISSGTMQTILLCSMYWVFRPVVHLGSVDIRGHNFGWITG